MKELKFVCVMCLMFFFTFIILLKPGILYKMIPINTFLTRCEF